MLLQYTDQEQAFAEHNRRMKMFRKSHPFPLRVKRLRSDLIRKLWPLLVLDTLKETGGVKRQVEMSKWSVLPPINMEVEAGMSRN